MGFEHGNYFILTFIMNPYLYFGSFWDKIACFHNENVYYPKELYRKGLTTKDAGGRGVVQCGEGDREGSSDVEVRTFLSKKKLFFEQKKKNALFWAKKKFFFWARDFSKFMVCPHGQWERRVELVRTFWGKGIKFRDFVWTSFMDGSK